MTITDDATQQPARDAEHLAAADRERIIHPYLPSTSTPRVVMTHGQGCQLWDADGRRYLDATGGLWLAQIGHGRPEIADVVARQMTRLEYSTSFWEFTHDRAIELATRLTDLSPDGLGHVYFTSGGSEGNDAAIKMARYYHWRRGDTNRTWILSRTNGYHGITYGSGSATGFSVYHAGFGPMMPHVRHLTPPWPYRTDLYDGPDCTEYCLRELQRTIEEIGPDNIAAMIGEPIMGVAGMIVPPEDYWPRVAELLRSYGILLISDEVVTAYGRVGEWFAAHRYGVRPDFITTAKGITSGYLPLGAVLVNDEVAEVLGRDHGFPMGYTYNGHPTSCAAALANLDIIEGEKLLDRSLEIGDFLHGELDRLGELPIVGEVRGVGMMLAVELVTDKTSRTPLPGVGALPGLIRRETGVMVRDGGHNLVLSPPLVMTRDEAVEVARGMRAVLARTDATGRVDG